MRLLPTSLGGRLIVGSMAFTLVAVVFTLVVMERILDRFVTGQIDQRLDNKLIALASQVAVTPDGTISIVGDADGPPFDKPKHKSFWWVGGPKNSVGTRWLRSDSFVPPTPAQIEAAPAPPPPLRPPPPSSDLDADSLPGPDLTPAPRPRTLQFAGPDGEPMHVRVVRRQIGGRLLTILAAAPVDAIKGPMSEALKTLATAVLLIGAVMLAAAFSLARLSLRPLTVLQRQVGDVRDGRLAALPPNQPSEIRPLVVELNALLAQNAENLSRARRHVANLAHGLKTPLATLSLQIERLSGDERAKMQALVGAIDRHVRHHLGRARSAALDGPVRTRTLLRPRLGDIGETLTKIHAEKHVIFAIQCDLDVTLACEPQDADEMLGNLLENAFKYTRRHVGCHVRVEGGTVIIDIDDDGPGLTTDEIERVLRPGQRLDEATPGHGFGLPIARELAELYGGDLHLTHQDTGLRATLTLPRARS